MVRVRSKIYLDLGWKRFHGLMPTSHYIPSYTFKSVPLGAHLLLKPSTNLSAQIIMNWLIGTKLWMDARYDELMIYVLRILIFVLQLNSKLASIFYRETLPNPNAKPIVK
jgi:hypothetical protein